MWSMRLYVVVDGVVDGVVDEMLDEMWAEKRVSISSFN